MQKSTIRRIAALALAALPALSLAACDGSSTGSTPQGRVAVVLNSTGRSLTVVSVDGTGADAHTISLGPEGSPVSLAVRNTTAVVPMGIYPFAKVVDLAAGTVPFTVALPANSGATGVAFVSDSVAIVANSSVNTVTPVNVKRGTAGTAIAVGTYPQAVVEGGSEVYVLEARFDASFSLIGPGTVSVVGRSLQKTGTVQLTGFNPQAGVVRGGRLYVVNGGHYGAGDGSLSVVNLATLHEEKLVPGFGELPGAIALGPDGNLYVGVYGTGIVVWNPDTQAFVRPLANPIVPNGAPPVSALGFDYAGRLHTVNPGNCVDPGKLFRLNPSTLAADRTVATGPCPFAIDFASVTSN